MTARVNRGLSGSGFQVPTLARDADDLAAADADAGAAVIPPRAAAPAPARPVVHRKVRLFGPRDDSGDELTPPERHIVFSLQAI
jgi:hypothetical protein